MRPNHHEIVLLTHNCIENTIFIPFIYNCSLWFGRGKYEKVSAYLKNYPTKRIAILFILQKENDSGEIGLKKMKKLLWILLIFFTNQISAQWIPQTSGTDGYLNSIYFVNQQDGWICGSGGTLLKTNDGGSSWEQISTNFNNDFYAIFFIDENIGWLVGSNGIILKTIDRGKEWNQQNSNTSYSLSDVFFVDENNGWITTGTINDTQVLKTTNGGQTWVSYPNGIITNAAVYFADANNGWVGGWGANLSRTTDGGIHLEVLLLKQLTGATPGLLCLLLIMISG